MQFLSVARKFSLRGILMLQAGTAPRLRYTVDTANVEWFSKKHGNSQALVLS